MVKYRLTQEESDRVENLHGGNRKFKVIKRNNAHLTPGNWVTLAFPNGGSSLASVLAVKRLDDDSLTKSLGPKCELTLLAIPNLRPQDVVVNG